MHFRFIPNSVPRLQEEANQRITSQSPARGPAWRGPRCGQPLARAGNEPPCLPGMAPDFRRKCPGRCCHQERMKLARVLGQRELKIQSVGQKEPAALSLQKGTLAAPPTNKRTAHWNGSLGSSAVAPSAGFRDTVRASQLLKAGRGCAGAEILNSALARGSSSNVLVPCMGGHAGEHAHAGIRMLR